MELFFIIACVITFITRAIKKAYMPRLKGWLGEQRVARIVKRLGNDYTSYHNVYVTKANGELTQVDHIVTSPFGIFVVETKNYTGTIYGAEQAMYWTQMIYRYKTKFYSPVFQNRTHVNALKHTLSLDIPFHSVIVFSNAAKLKLPAFEDAHVIQLKALRKHIKRYREPVLSAQQLHTINEALHHVMTNIAARKRQIKRQHLQQVKGIQKHARMNEQRMTVELICPTCGSPLVQRMGKFGLFYGCSRFPTCRFTERIDK